eukprot:c4717_g1_i1.p1 GENE.c4717_g1_i1~~c4717_g1_i1.p1  ORF type:complete len:337 (-),score=79.76 c4717_g1_i1:25-1035(-)
MMLKKSKSRFGFGRDIEQITDLKLTDLEMGVTLGTGSFGRVKLVRHKKTGKYYALKMLKKHFIIQVQQTDHIKSEKQILQQVNHPNIVNYIGSCQDPKYLYIMMEYVQGGEFFTHLRKAGKFPNNTAVYYAAQVLLALYHLHEKHIVYRDLKPENLLMDKNGNCKITDFGFAKKIDYKTWTLCGTPEYLAPELILSKGHNKGADYWALGVLIYEMLAGYPPFYDDDHIQLYQLILSRNIKFPFHFDKSAKDIIKKLCEPDLTKRYGCMANGIEDIKQHKWFKGIDWEELENATLTPPIIPKVSNEADTSNFDQYEESPHPPPGISVADQKRYFDDF